MEKIPTVNPWIHMWTSPKETMRYLLATNPRKGFWFLSFIYIFSSLSGFYLPFLSSVNVPPQEFSAFGFALRVVLSLLFTLLAGAFFLIIESFFTWLTGKILKGKAKWMEVRCAVSWSKVPLLLLFLTNGVLFPSLSWIVNLGNLIAMVWVIVLWVGAIAETQKFSTGRAIVNLFLNLGVGLILFLLVIFFFLIVDSLARS